MSASADDHTALTLDAVVARLIPADEGGGGALEAEVPVYIRRALAGDYARYLDVYAAGLAGLDRWALARHGTSFASLDATTQDELLGEAEGGGGGVPPAVHALFPVVLAHTMEGMFGDPLHGGNVDALGWRLIGYAGPRREWGEADQRLDAP